MNIRFRVNTQSILLDTFKEFLQGAKDCRAGLTCRPGCSESYLRGYGLQYEIEQKQTWRTDHDY